jgi:segregation and condensation protein B
MIMEYEQILESILFAAGDPYPISRLSEILELSEDRVSELAAALADRLRFEHRGICLVRLEDSLQLCSVSENAEWVRKALDTRKGSRLSPAALEVLAIAAYFQPVTRSYVEQLRGVDSSYTMGLLADKGFLEPCGRLDAPGRPMQYKTTALFLRTFGLSTLTELPTQGVEDLRDKLASAQEQEGQQIQFGEEEA